MSRLTFKRIALGLVGVLGLGVLSSGPTNAAPIASSDTLTVSANTLTVGVGDTGSVTISTSFIGGAALSASNGESLVVNIQNQSAPTAATTATRHGLYITDSSNLTISVNAADGDNSQSPLGSAGADGFGSGTPEFQRDFGPRGTVGGSTPLAYNAILRAGMNPNGAVAGSASFAWRFIAPDAAGTYVYRVYLTAGTNTTYSPVSTPQTITVTVTANTSAVASGANSLAYINQPAAFTGSTGYARDASARDYKSLEADSALVVSAGTAASPAIVGVMHFVVENASDTKVSTISNPDVTSGTLSNFRVKDSVTVVISGPGLLAGASQYSNTLGTRAKQVLVNWNESVVVYSDGTAGTGTITTYIGTSVTANGKLAQAAKTVTFTGRATTFTVSGATADIRAGSAVKYASAADSANATIRFLAADAAGNAVTSAALSVLPGDSAQDNTKFWAISSDTSILAAGEAGTTFATSAARRSPALECTYDAATAFWTCSGRIFDSGTVTLTVVDSRTVSGSSVLTTTTSAVNKSAAFSLTIAGGGYTGTISLGKTSFNVNEAATLTLTCKDSGGLNVATGNDTTCFRNLSWKGAAPTFAANSAANASGGTFTNLQTYLDGSGSVALNETSYVDGVDTAMVFMPSTAGTYTLLGRTGNATTDSELLTFTVSDPVATATLAAADAATDAANEAIDAANAATDAANIAAEAADAATVAAEEARDAADAATAAVEELATQVATLMAALSAQVKTLANTVAKIAKKVKA
jgi:hypothetical protein